MTAVDWTQVLVGHQSPAGLPTIGNAAKGRNLTAEAHRQYADLLHQQQSTSLSDQYGITADDIRDAFTQGENYHQHLSETNSIIASAYNTSYDSGVELRRQLNTIAHDGNGRINQIQNSKDALPVKVAKITQVVVDCQNEANLQAATHCETVFDQMQKVLDQRGLPMSARQFAADHGVDLSRSFASPNESALKQQVETALNRSGSHAAVRPVSCQSKPQSGPAPAPNNLQPGNLGPAPSDRPASSAAGQRSTLGSALPTIRPVSALRAPTGDLGSAPPTAPRTSSATFPGVGSVSASAGPHVGNPVGAPLSTPGMPFSPSGAPTMAAVGAPPFAPTTLAQSFDHGFDRGLQMGNPLGATANAMPPTGPVAPQLPPPSLQPASSTLPSGSSAPIFDTAHASAVTPIAPAHITSDTTPAFMAAPPVTPQVSAASANPLPAYGADIRPPVVAPPAPPAPTTAPAGPLAAAPSAGPVSPSAGLSQPAMVRQATAPAPPSTPAVLGEQAVVATAGGSGAGAASALATAKARLQRLVDAVARQAPRLAWVAGDRPDGTTVLATDLASGWVPPDVNLPTAVKLLEPAQRRGDLVSLLGEVTTSASYAPIHYLPAAEDKEAVPTSSRVRQGPVVDELGWELGQATKWRDGLPRLAHTIAKAAAAGTGVLDSEIDLLKEQLDVVRDHVLDAYPEDVDPAAIGNWQLLAAIDALAANDQVGANYHFAWFKALNQPASAEGI